MIGRPAPKWAEWTYKNEHLPATFHKMKGKGSIIQLLLWLKGQPLTPIHGQPASYGRVEKALLTVGLALRDMHIVAFMDPDNSGHLPIHIQASPFEIKDYEALGMECKMLLTYVPYVIHCSTNCSGLMITQ